LKIARFEFDLPATYSGDGSCDDSRGFISSGGMGGACRSVLGGGGNGIHVLPEIESSLPPLFGASLVAAKFSPGAVCDANASPDGSVGAPLVAASFLSHAVRDANASPDGLFGAPLVAATFLSHAVRDPNVFLDSSVGTPLVAATFSPRAMCDANASLDGYVGAPILFAICTTHLMMN